MEIFDIYDAYGNKTERTAIKGHKCINNEYYLGIHVYIYNFNNEFLLQKRVATKKFRPNKWEFLLEHAIAGENSIDSAIRGVKEELGLSFTQNNFEFLSRFMWHEENTIIDAYFLHADINIDDMVIQEEELSTVKWVSKSEMIEFVKQMKAYRPIEYSDMILAHIQRL